MDSPVLLLSLVSALVAAGLVFLVLRSRERGSAQPEFAALHAATESLAAQQNQLAGRMAALAEAAAAQQAELARSLNERLDIVGRRIGETLVESAEKTGKTVADLQVRLAVIDQAQQNLTELSRQVVGLQDILDNKQRRGQFGEEILETLVQDALPAGVFEFQATLSNRARADCLIRLPNPPGPIAIDSKFPLEAYRQLVAATDDATRLPARRAFQIALEKHVSDIAEKYIVPGETAEGALMFLPSEAVYAELHVAFPDLVEKSRRRRVYPVSPSTLMATLTTIRAVLRDARMREQAKEIQKHVHQLSDDVVRLIDRVDNLKKHFGQAEKDIREIETSATKIGRKATQIGELEVEDAGSTSLPGQNPGSPDRD